MAHDNRNKLPTSGGLPTNAEDEETDKGAAHEQEQKKEPLESTRQFRVTNLVDYIAELLREERAAYLANIGRDKRVLNIDRIRRTSLFQKRTRRFRSAQTRRAR